MPSVSQPQEHRPAKVVLLVFLVHWVTIAGAITIYSAGACVGIFEKELPGGLRWVFRRRSQQPHRLAHQEFLRVHNNSPLL